MVIEPNTWIRQRRRTRGFAVAAACWSVGMLMIAPVAILSAHSHWHNTVGNDVGLGVFVCALAAAGFWMAHRLATAGVWLGSDGITVKGPFKARSLSVVDAQAFVPGVWGSGVNGTPCPVLKRTHGPAVGLWALGRDGVIWRYARYADELQPLCDQLNEVLRAVKSHAATGMSSTAR